MVTRSAIVILLAVLGAVCAFVLLLDVRTPEVVIAAGLFFVSVGLLVLSS